MRIFSNFHSTFTDSESASAFEINRVYLGYAYNFSPNFSALATIDMANPGTGGLEMDAYIKNAYLSYRYEKLTAGFGLIGTTQFKTQEDFWGYRYIEKSFQDLAGFGSSADLGLSVSYRFSDALSADVIVMNGEGYKKLEADSTLRTGIGLSLTPTGKLTGRVYYDFSSKDETLSTLALFAGYATERFSLGGEFNKQWNNKFLKDHDLQGYSFYTTFKASDRIRLFARYDRLESGRTDGTSEDWNISKDGDRYLAGMEYSPLKGLKFSPNFRGWNPALGGEPFSASFYLNCEIKL